MRSLRFTRLVACVILTALAGGVTVATAAAESLPEAGYCVKVPTGTGSYKNATCLTPETGTRGKYSFHALTTSATETNPSFSLSGGAVALKTSGLSPILCESAGITGEYTGPKSSTDKAALTGCRIEPGGTATGAACQTGATSGQIEVTAAEGELGFITDQVVNGKRVVQVGLDLHPHAPSTELLTAVCAAGKTSMEHVVVEGSVIARATPIDHMSGGLTLLYKATRTGHQVPEMFEGATKDTLTTSFTGLAGMFSGPSTLTIATVTGTNSVPLEIKAQQ
jgi:hypothetical protein